MQAEMNSISLNNETKWIHSIETAISSIVLQLRPKVSCILIVL